jgi:hypothetical protein
MQIMQMRLVAGALAYGVLGGLAALTLDGKIRIATLLFLGALALRTFIAIKREQS